MAGKKWTRSRSTVSRIEDIKPSTVLYKDVRQLAPQILGETIISIDPSCGSSSSMPGYAVFRAGELIDSGVLSLSVGADLHIRLQELLAELDILILEHEPTILVYENVPAVRFHKGGGTSSGSQASLLKAVGVVMAGAHCTYAVGLRPSTWKRLVTPTYVKGDETDAIEMGGIVLRLAKHIMDTHPPRTRSSR